MLSTSRTLSSGFQRKASLAVLSAILLAVAYVGINDSNRSSVVLRGDFPAFFAGGVIAGSDFSDKLYDFNLQREIENEAWPSLGGQALVNAYPPYVSALAVSLAWFAPSTAKLLHALLSLVALVLTAVWVASLADSEQPKPLVVLALLICFAPILHGALGGQNTAFSLACLCAAFTLLKRGDRRSDMLAGLWLGLWLFKPNLALIVIAGLVLSGRLFVLPGVFLVAGIYEALAASVLGFWWLRPWLEAAGRFQAADMLYNSHQMVSLGGAASALGANQFLFSSANQGFLAGTLISVLLFFLLVYRLRRSQNFDTFWALTSAAVLLSPHTVYYDVGLCLIPLIATGKLKQELIGTRPIALLAAAAICVGFKQIFIVQPLILLPLWLLTRQLLDSRRQLS